MSNKNFDELINNIKSKQSGKETEEYLRQNLSTDQNNKLKEILNDKEAIKKILSTPKAQELLRRFREDKND